MHHIPESPPRSARIPGALRRRRAGARHALAFRPRRAVLLALGMVAGVIALAVPVLSATGSRVSLDTSATYATDDSSPVVLGVDGRPAAATPAQPRPTASPVGSAPADAGRDGAADSVDAGSSAGPATPTGASGPERKRTGPSSAAASAGTSSATSAGTSAGTSPAGASPAGTSAPGSASSSPSDPADTTTSASPPPPPVPAGAVLALVDDARAGAGCGALTVDDRLATAAVTNSTDMATQGTAGVLDPAGTAAAVAQGQPDADTVVSAWLADATTSGHLLDCGLTSAGVGRVDAPGGPWWTLFLA